MKKVLIGGGSGLVGGKLTKMLQEKGYEVAHLSRSAKGNGVKIIQWDVNLQKLNSKEIEDFDHIINLTGAGIIDEPWTEKRKQVIIDSRVKSNQLIAKAIKSNAKKPESFVSASAVGYYGFVTNDVIFKETHQAGTDFLAETCVLWEESTKEIEELNIPTSRIRIGMVLTDEGGALKEMAKPIKLGFGAALGSGDQWIPWIHLDDLCHLFIHAMINKLQGSFNAGAPQQVTNQQFTSVLAKVLSKPLWLPNVPRFILKLILGSRSLLVLEGSRVSPEKIQETGFHFKYKDLEEALNAIYKR